MGREGRWEGRGREGQLSEPLLAAWSLSCKRLVGWVWGVRVVVSLRGSNRGTWVFLLVRCWGTLSWDRGPEQNGSSLQRISGCSSGRVAF